VNTFDESKPLSAPLPAEYQSPSGQEFVPPPAVESDPDNPQWGVPAAFLTWVASIVLLVGVQLIVGLPYVFYRFRETGIDGLQGLINDKTFVFLTVVSTLPAHALTLLVAWAVVTHWGKHPFGSALGWSWGEHFGLWTSAGLAIVLLVVVGILAQYIGGKETDLDQIVNSSAASRYALAFLATASAPLVEELVYRGMLYPTLQRAAGRLASYLNFRETKQLGTLTAVILVSALFASVHVLQYRNNLGVIVGVSALSLALTSVRAYTGKLLPCFMIHTVFNGIQSVYIAFGPYFEKYFHAQPEPKTPALLMLAHIIHNFI
jgi:CAAX protease family protein